MFIIFRENAKARTSTIRQTLTTRSTNRWPGIMENIHYENVQGSCTWVFLSSGEYLTVNFYAGLSTCGLLSVVQLVAL